MVKAQLLTLKILQEAPAEAKDDTKEEKDN